MKSDTQTGSYRGWLRIEFVGTVNTGVNAYSNGVGDTPKVVVSTSWGRIYKRRKTCSRISWK